MLWPSTADQGSETRDLYRFGPGLTISVRGERRARAYFRTEYGAASLRYRLGGARPRGGRFGDRARDISGGRARAVGVPTSSRGGAHRFR